MTRQNPRVSASSRRLANAFLLSTFAFLLGYAVAGEAATAYPAKPVRLIVPYPPGGGNDTLARLFGTKLSEAWGQQVVVDNRPGAGTIIGTQLAARSVPDGYTLLLSSIATHAIAPNLYAKPGYDPVKDFAPITLLAVAPTVPVAAAFRSRSSTGSMPSSAASLSIWPSCAKHTCTAPNPRIAPHGGLFV